MYRLSLHCTKLNSINKFGHRNCVHLGSKALSFAKWADNRPSCLKHKGNLVHFSCKCLSRKRYKT